MLGMVAVGYLGLNLARFQGFERYANVAAGLAIAMGGTAIWYSAFNRPQFDIPLNFADPRPSALTIRWQVTGPALSYSHS